MIIEEDLDAKSSPTNKRLIDSSLGGEDEEDPRKTCRGCLEEKNK